MKSPRPKIHLIDVSEPLLAYHQLVMRCGVTLRNAEPKFMLTEDFSLLWAGVTGLCRECAKSEASTDDTDVRTYIYGLTEGQEEKDSADV